MAERVPASRVLHSTICAACVTHVVEPSPRLTLSTRQQVRSDIEGCLSILPAVDRAVEAAGGNRQLRVLDLGSGAGNSVAPFAMHLQQFVTFVTLWQGYQAYQSR